MTGMTAVKRSEIGGSWGGQRVAKAAGKVRKEGKDYVVEDGDILNILASG